MTPSEVEQFCRMVAETVERELSSLSWLEVVPSFTPTFEPAVVCKGAAQEDGKVDVAGVILSECEELDESKARLLAMSIGRSLVKAACLRMYPDFAQRRRNHLRAEYLRLHPETQPQN